MNETASSPESATDRQLLSEGRWDSTGFFSATQDIRRGVVWTVQRDVDTVIVHFGGPIAKLETELEGCGSVFGSPMPGEVWVVPAGQRYSSSANGGCVHYAELQFDRQRAEAEIPGLRGRTPGPLAGHYDPALAHGARRLEELGRATDDLSQLAAASLSRTLLLDFYCRYASSGPPTAYSRRIRFTVDERRRTEAFIEENLGSALRLEALASLVHMTTHEVLIAFRAAFGTTPAQYVINQRVRQARRLLATSKKPIADIAVETGFSSQAHLASCFRARLQMTPGEFRRGRGETH